MVERTGGAASSARLRAAPGASRWMPAVAPLLLAAGFLAAGHPHRAAVLAAFASVATMLITTGAPISRLIERAVRVVVHAVTTAVFGALFVLAFIPAWVLGGIRRRRKMGEPVGWRSRPPSTGPTGSFSASATLPERRLRHQLVAAVGIVVLLMAADYGIGVAWDARHDGDQPSASLTVSERETLTASAGAAGADRAADPRAAQPSMASSPWAVAYFRDLQDQAFGPWPFTAVKPADFTSPYINVTDWARRSWSAPGGADRPTIWLFGGSGMFGEGQRDEHTIASELARIADAEGRPISVVNYGQRGWVHWQEMLLFEQLLDRHDQPDLAVFYDGPNDITAAGRYGDGVPTTLTESVDGSGDPANLSTQILSEGDDGRSLPAQLWSAYAEHSALRKVARAMGVIPEPAGAQGGGDGDGGDDTGRTEVDPTAFSTEEIAAVAIATYGRGRLLTDHVAATHDIPVRHMLQPQYYDDFAVWAYVRAHWPQPTTDLTDTVANRRDEVFIDGVHTNELGARLIAQGMWQALQTDVEHWYAKHD